jgi:hypothetical protein
MRIVSDFQVTSTNFQVRHNKVVNSTQTNTTCPPSRALRCPTATTIELQHPTSKIPPSTPSPIPTPIQGHEPSKLPKSLKKANRDRAESMTGPIATGTGTGNSANIASSSSSGSGNNVERKGGSRLGGGLVNKAASDTMYVLLVIIEPVPTLTRRTPTRANEHDQTL